jgi:hypothetical protein
MKGVEGLPLKYIIMLLVAVIIIATLIHVTNMFSATAIAGTEQANQTLNTVLEESLGNVLKNSANP